MLDQITPMLITYNEAANIRRNLDKLVWARRILVIDSGSEDETIEMARAYPQVDVIHHSFKDFASQCNFGLTQVASPWVLSLDADYELSNELVTEMKSLAPAAAVSGYFARFVYRVYGKALRGTLYPPRVVLYRTDKARYRSEGHGHRVTVDGEIASLKGKIYHDDRKPLGRWIATQQLYAREEAKYLLESEHADLTIPDKIRRMGWPAPMAVFLYALLFKRCLFDGWPGWFYVMQRLIAETLIALEVIDQRWRGTGQSERSQAL
jgi:glycosyltransferase involved in cell wall biosynthesis